MTMNTDAVPHELIRSLRNLESKATKGPWVYQENSDAYTHILRSDDAPGTYVVHFPQGYKSRQEADARFVAAMRNALPALLDEIEASRAVTLASEVQAEAVRVDDASADAIVSSLYRRFKEWSKRGFGPEDVTWCEVKAEVGALIATKRGDHAKPTLPAAVLDALRFYAHGHHYSIDDSQQQFDTVSGEPRNWLFSERDDDCTMIEDGSIAKAVLLGGLSGFEEPTEPLEGEVFAPAARSGDDAVREVIGYVPNYIIDEWRAGRNIHVHVSRAQTVNHDTAIYAAPAASAGDQEVERG